MTVDDTPPWEQDEGGFGATFKAGKGYEDPWFTIRDKTAGGLKRRIIAAFGFDEEACEELTLVAVIHNATQEFHAHGSIGREFPGSRAVSSRRGRGRASAEAGNDQAEQEQPEQAEDPNAGLLAAVEAATTVDELKRFWVEHNPLSAEVEAAWRAKGKALKEQGGN